MDSCISIFVGQQFRANYTHPCAQARSPNITLITTVYFWYRRPRKLLSSLCLSKKTLRQSIGHVGKYLHLEGKDEDTSLWKVQEAVEDSGTTMPSKIWLLTELPSGRCIHWCTLDYDQRPSEMCGEDKDSGISDLNFAEATVKRGWGRSNAASSK